MDNVLTKVTALLSAFAHRSLRLVWQPHSAAATKLMRMTNAALLLGVPDRTPQKYGV